MKRTSNYFQANMTPLWIMAGKNIKRKGSNKISLSSFDYLFLSKSPTQQWRIPAFCPTTNTLILMHSILPVTIKNILAKYSMINLEMAQLTDLLDSPCNQPVRINDWQNEIRKVKNTIGAYGTRQNGLPVFNAPFIETSVLKWQSYLLIDVFSLQRPFSIKEVYHAVRKRVRKGDVKIRDFPLVKEGSDLAAVKEYIQLLVKVNYLKMVNHNYFQVARKQYADNYMEQERMEIDFYQSYGKIISNSLIKYNDGNRPY